VLLLFAFSELPSPRRSDRCFIRPGQAGGPFALVLNRLPIPGMSGIQATTRIRPIPGARLMRPRAGQSVDHAELHATIVRIHGCDTRQRSARALAERREPVGIDATLEERLVDGERPAPGQHEVLIR